MKPETFSKREAIQFGWQTMKENFLSFVVILASTYVISSIPSFLINFVIKDKPTLSLFIYFASIIISILIAMGYVRIALKLCDHEKAKFTDMFMSYPIFFNYLVGSCIYALIVVVGLFIFIVPGIIWGIKYQFYGYFIIDKGYEPLQALKKSSEITKGVKVDLYLFMFITTCLNLLGILALVIGLFATVPTTMVAYAYVYRRLTSRTGALPTSPTQGTIANPER